jgi:hypothetical protein
VSQHQVIGRFRSPPLEYTVARVAFP